MALVIFNTLFLLPRFRVLVVDNDMLSFTDVRFRDWPIVLITNPKDALFTSPKEPGHRMKASSHIRQVNAIIMKKKTH